MLSNHFSSCVELDLIQSADSWSLCCSESEHVGPPPGHPSVPGALAELDLKSFQGRPLRLRAAQQKPQKETETAGKVPWGLGATGD